MPTQNKFTVLIINSGSSSVKFTLYQMPEETILASGAVERIGLESSGLQFQNNRGDIHRQLASVENVEEAITELMGLLTHSKLGVIKSKQVVSAVGHRVVHGGESITAPTIIDDAVKQIIAENSQLAPLHNPSNLNGVDAIVFTAGIGENSPTIREMVCNSGDGMDKLGIVLDTGKNTAAPLTTPEIQTHDSRVKILVIPTDEALEIARQTCVLF